MKKILLLLLLLGVAYIWVLFSPNGHWLPFYRQIYSVQAYEKLLVEQQEQRQNFVGDSTERQALFVGQAQQIFRFWYGTAWDMNGMSQKPGHGKIACGYFVCTVLEDMGFAIQRIKFSQMPSEKMISQLLPTNYIYRYIGLDFEDFMQKIQAHGQGLYVVGLDTHTGFLLLEQGQILFIHSRRTAPNGVVAEDAWQAQSLKNSNYRILGKLSACPSFVQQIFK